MKRFLKWTAGALLALLLAGASLAAHTRHFKPLSIDWFYARVFLRVGALPLALLERVIDAYIARRKAT